MGILFTLAVIACLCALVWVFSSWAIDKGHAYVQWQKAQIEMAKLVKPKKKNIKADVDWAALVAPKPKGEQTIKKPRKKPTNPLNIINTIPGQKFRGLPPGAKKLDI